VTWLDDVALLRLLQLTSPALPLGTFAYSQGLEYAVAAGWVKGEADVLEWTSGLLEGPLSRLDLPMVARMHAAWRSEDEPAVREWSALLLAHRESRELEDEDLHVGHSLARVLVGHGVTKAEPWLRSSDATFAALFALAASEWNVPRRSALLGHAFAWSEAQAGAASRLLPLGQLAIQRVVSALLERIPAAVAVAEGLPDDELGGLAPSHAMATALHETQYSRLFRS
jgi:urease accessory protein